MTLAGQRVWRLDNRVVVVDVATMMGDLGPKDDVIFMRQGKDLIELVVADYEAEKAIQELLENHSQLLAGAQMNPGDPPRFVLVRREAPVPDRVDSSGRWSLDHLFLDQRAIPTLVEVKRSQNPQLRREVVGQMLDYAANGPRHWEPGTLRLFFERTCEESQLDPLDVITTFVPDRDVEEFWALAERNLREGELRLVFLADVIPVELRSIINFLHRRMSDIEVYGVEVRRYAGANGEECLVPRLVTDVIGVEPPRAGKRIINQWDEESFFDELARVGDGSAGRVARQLLDWAKPRFTLAWGTGAKVGGMNLRLPEAGYAFLQVQTDGKCIFSWGWPHSLPPTAREALRNECIDRLNLIPGITVPLDQRKPTMPLLVLDDPSTYAAFRDTLQWVLDASRASADSVRGGPVSS